jgi:hypothetical protein
MKRLAILTFFLGVVVAPFQAQAQKPVEFNGMVFDPPPAKAMRPPNQRPHPSPEHPRINSTSTRTTTTSILRHNGSAPRMLSGPISAAASCSSTCWREGGRVYGLRVSALAPCGRGPVDVATCSDGRGVRLRISRANGPRARSHPLGELPHIRATGGALPSG